MMVRAGRTTNSPSTRRMTGGPTAGDRPDCYWLHLFSNRSAQATLQEPIKDPARLDWHEVSKISRYYLTVGAMTRPMQVREDTPPYGGLK